MHTNDSLIATLVDAIIEYKKQLKFAAASEKASVEQAFWQSVEALRESAPAAVAKAARSILAGRSAPLQAEEVRIRMECAGLWCDEPVRLMALRISARTGAWDEADVAAFSALVSEAYAAAPADGSFSMSAFDRQNAVESFVRTLALSADPADGQLLRRLAQSLSGQTVTSIQTAITAVCLQKLLPRELRSKLPRPVTQVCRVATGLAALECDGLALWSTNNRLSDLEALVRATQACGLSELAALLSAYHADLVAYLAERGLTLADLRTASDEAYAALIARHERELLAACAAEHVEPRLTACLTARSSGSKM